MKILKKGIFVIFILFLLCNNASAKDLMSQKLDLNFQNVPLSTVLTGLAEALDLNLAIAPMGLSQQITISIKNSSLKQVLDQLAFLGNASWEFRDNMLIFAQKGEFQSENERIAGEYVFKYRKVDDIESLIKDGAEDIDSNTTITTDIAGNRVMFSSLATQYKAIHDLCAAIDSPLKNIIVDCVFLDVNYNDGESGGISWGWDTLNFVLGEGTSLLEGTLTRQDLDIQASLAGAINSGNAKVLNSSSLSVESGCTATLSSGEESPIITNDIESGPKTEYKSTGIDMEVTPTLIGDRIYMDVKPSFSEVTGTVKTAMTEAPIVSERSVETKTALCDGEWFIIGGLIKDKTSTSGSGVPLLQDIPLVGGVFKSSTKTVTKTQTIIMIRPRIKGSLKNDEFMQFSSNMTDQISKITDQKSPDIKPKGELDNNVTDVDKKLQGLYIKYLPATGSIGNKQQPIHKEASGIEISKEAVIP